jgi:hypothetical protein
MIIPALKKNPIYEIKLAYMAKTSTDYLYRLKAKNLISPKEQP